MNYILRKQNRKKSGNWWNGKQSRGKKLIKPKAISFKWPIKLINFCIDQEEMEERHNDQYLAWNKEAALQTLQTLKGQEGNGINMMRAN